VNLRIDPEFKSLLSPLSPDEYNLLEESILSEGCRDALVVWDDIIIDGHNRYEICQHHNLPYETAPMDFESKADAKIWIVTNQLGRRNLTPFIRVELAKLIEPEIKEKARENQGTRTDILQKSAESTKPVDTREEIAKVAGVSHDTVAKASKIIEKAPEEVKEAVRQGDLTINKAYTQIVKQERDEKEKEMKAKLEEIAVPTKLYDVVVIDPAWEIQKIIRDIRPNQKEFDYPTMTLDEIKNFQINDLMANDCHVFLWTTQKWLPHVFDVLKEWGLIYVLTLVWHKKGGFQPFGLPQYNCEFVVYAHKGNPKFVDTKAFSCCFDGDRGKHSEKPDNFYALLDRVCEGRKIDVFARKERLGWDTYGNEVL